MAFSLLIFFLLAKINANIYYDDSPSFAVPTVPLLLRDRMSPLVPMDLNQPNLLAELVGIP